MKQLKILPTTVTPRMSEIDIDMALTRIFTALVVLSGATVVCAICLTGLSLKRSTPLVIDQKGAPHQTRPLGNNEVSKPEAIRRSLEYRLPRLYTWSGVIRDASDPTGMKFVKDEGTPVTVWDAEAKQTKTVGRVPKTVSDEQFYLAEPIREATMVAIASLIEKTKGVLWQTNPDIPQLGISYRFRFRNRPSLPEEMQPDSAGNRRWKTIVTGDILKISPGAGMVPTEKAIQTFSYELYVVEVPPQGALVNDGNRDLIEYGTSDGFNISAFVPYQPNKEDIANPQ